MNTFPHLSCSGAGRVLLHALCLLQRPARFAWHWQGIRRELSIPACCQPARLASALHHPCGTAAALVGVALAALPAFALAQGTYLSAPDGNPTNALIVAPGGNIGIGTSSPQTALDVVGTMHLSGGELWTEGHWAVRLKSPISSVWRTTTQDRAGKYLGFGMTDTGWYFLRSHAADTSAESEEPVVIRNTGKVGIGTTDPTEQLEVVGGIMTEGPTPGFSRFILKSTAEGGQQYEWYNDFGNAGSGILALYNRTSQNRPIAFTSSGNVGIGTIEPQAKLDVAGKVNCQVLELTSDRNAKANFHPLNLAEVLEKISGLSITEWEFTNAPGVRHCGAMAQDFHHAFGLGTDDRHINPLDAASIALLGVQALHEELQNTKAQLSTRDAELAALKSEMTTLKQDLAARLGAVERLVAADISPRTSAASAPTHVGDCAPPAKRDEAARSVSQPAALRSVNE